MRPSPITGGQTFQNVTARQDERGSFPAEVPGRYNAESAVTVRTWPTARTASPEASGEQAHGAAEPATTGRELTAAATDDDRRKTDRAEDQGDAKAEGRHEQHAEGEFVKRDRHQEHDQGGAVGYEAADYPDRDRVTARQFKAGRNVGMGMNVWVVMAVWWSWSVQPLRSPSIVSGPTARVAPDPRRRERPGCPLPA